MPEDRCETFCFDEKKVNRLQEKINVSQWSPLTCEIVSVELGEGAAAFGSEASFLMQAGELKLSGMVLAVSGV